MSRAKWKGPFISNKNLSKDKKLKKIWTRSEVIASNCLNKKVMVYNGQKFINVFVNSSKLGLKYGEFCFTRKKGEKQLKTTKKK